MQSVPVSIVVLQIAAAGALCAWAWIICRMFRGQPLLAMESRRPVPWNGIDLLIVLAVLLFLQVECMNLAFSWTGTSWPDEAAQLNSRQQLVQLTSHFVASVLTLAFGSALVALRADATVLDLGIDFHRAPSDLRCGVVAFFAAAPIVFGLQAILINWLLPYEHPVIEAIGKHPSGWALAMLVVSTVVVAPLVEEFLFRVLLQGWLEKVEGTLRASAHDAPHRFGFSPGFMPIIVSSFVFSLMHYGQGPAIVPLFVFALVLGYLYRYTHRLLPSLTVHLLLNAVSLAMLFTQPNSA